MASNSKITKTNAPSSNDGDIELDDIFMYMAYLISKHSKDPKRKVGACIVSEDNQIVGFGYNDFPKGTPDEYWENQDTKNKYVCHGELNAFINRNKHSVINGKIYVTLCPCEDCTKVIFKLGLTVVRYDDSAIKWNTDLVSHFMKENPILIERQNIKRNNKYFKKIDNYYEPKENYDNYFMYAAYLFSTQCKKTTGNGACIINENNQIVGVGYDIIETIGGKKVKFCAESNAYVNSQCGRIESGKIFVTSYPCKQCAQLIVQCGIQDVYYMDRTKKKSSDPLDIIASNIFQFAGIARHPMTMLNDDDEMEA